MVFRKGGKLADREKWTYEGRPIHVVSEYCYLGVTLTPTLSFKTHIHVRECKAQNAIDKSWNALMLRKNVSIPTKCKFFNLVARPMQIYGAPVFGFKYFEDIDKLKRNYLKKIINLPDFSSTYALILDSGLENTHFHTLELHMKYIIKATFLYNRSRLPHILSKEIIRRNIWWFKEWRAYEPDVRWDTLDIDMWKSNIQICINALRCTERQQLIARAQQSTGVYKYLDFSSGVNYFHGNLNIKQIRWIFKARANIIGLNGARWRNGQQRKCSLCNLSVEETVQHFVGTCPVLKEIRVTYLGKCELSEQETIATLNGYQECWRELSSYIEKAFFYRKFLIEEFNF